MEWKVKLQSLNAISLVTFTVFFFTGIFNVTSIDDIYYLKACYPWFRAPDNRVGHNNCSLGCSLQTPLSGLSQQEVALCLKDGRTGVECKSDSDCKRWMDLSYCKKALCLCEDRSTDRFYSTIDASTADSTLQFCAASADVRSIHIPLVLFPWKTLMIIFGTLVMTGLLLMTLKWISPIISTIRDYQGSELSQQRRLRVEDVNEAYRNQHAQERIHPSIPDKPPPYETAVQLTSDSLPTYEEIHKSQFFTRDDEIPIVSPQCFPNLTPVTEISHSLVPSTSSPDFSASPPVEATTDRLLSQTVVDSNEANTRVKF